MEREKGRCFYCTNPVRVHRRATQKGKRPPRDHATIDHIVPEAWGGETTSENCVCACNACNNERGTLDAMVFLARKRAERGLHIRPVEPAFT